MKRTAAIGLLFVLGCADLAAPEPPSPRWTRGVAAVLAKCKACHDEGGTLPVLTRFTGVASCRADGTPWMTPDDTSSLLLRVFDRPDHAALLAADELALLRAWVTSGGTAYETLLAHGPGWANPGSGGEFHGKFLADRGYAPIFSDPAKDGGACMTCHDQAVEKGGAIPCTTCHGDSFTLDHCDTCHGENGNPRPVARPCDTAARRARVGAHAFHRDPPLDPAFPAVACATCHAVPQKVTDPGHLDANNDGADVRFDPARVPEGTWTASAHSCAVKVCHADKTMQWNAETTTSTTVRCDGCHGNPPSSHHIDRCTLCHSKGLDAATGRPTARTHLDGIVEVGKECTDCHTMGPEPAFPGDSPGAHRAHLTGTRFRRPLECSACHKVPTEVGSPGHLDSPLPADLTFGAVATSSGALVPTFDDSTKRCSDVRCHGADMSGGTTETPPWVVNTSTTSPVVCGSCHGLPPLTAEHGTKQHPPVGTPADCGGCHVTREGLPITRLLEITEAGKSAHIDGCVELPGECR